MREGKRHSMVNFHSTRRWFATSADRAGQQEAVIKDVIGHVPDKNNVNRAAYIARSLGHRCGVVWRPSGCRPSREL